MGLRKFAAAAGKLSLGENFLIQLPRYPALGRRRKRDEESGCNTLKFSRSPPIIHQSSSIFINEALKVLFSLSRTRALIFPVGALTARTQVIKPLAACLREYLELFLLLIW